MKGLHIDNGRNGMKNWQVALITAIITYMAHSQISQLPLVNKLPTV